MLCVTLTLKVKVMITLNGTANLCLYACFIMHIFKIIAEYIIFIVPFKVIHSQGSYEQMKGCIQVPTVKPFILAALKFSVLPFVDILAAL